MHRTIIVAVMGIAAGLASVVYAQEDVRRAQVIAAADDASRRLDAEVMSTGVTSDLTVGQLAERTGSREALEQTLRTAEQVGGTRWIDDQTTQVRLELTGDAVARTLQTAADSHPHALPVSKDVLRSGLKTLKSRTFAATGSSTSAAASDRLRPDPSQSGWRGVSDADRRQAIVAARHNAASRMLDSVSAVEVVPDHPLSEALARPPVQQTVGDWLMSRPITSVEFRDDLEIRLVLGAPPEDFCRVLRAALARQEKTPLPTDEAAWRRFCERVESHLSLPLGRGLVAAPGTAPAVPSAIVLPAEPPRWVRDAIDVDGAAHGGGPLLRTARVAEDSAMQRMRARVEALPLSPGLTLGQAAHQDAHVADGLTRAMRFAHTYKVDYNDPVPGAVRIKVHIELEDVWREIAQP